MELLNISQEDVADFKEGDILLLFGHKYKLERKRTTAILVRRWYWWDTLGEKLAEMVRNG